MRIAIVESKDEDRSVLTEYCKDFNLIRDTFGFKCLHDALLFVSSHPVDVLILNLETPHAFGLLCEKGTMRLDGPFLILTAGNMHLLDKVEENEKVLAHFQKPVPKLQLLDTLVQANKKYTFIQR